MDDFIQSLLFYAPSLAVAGVLTLGLFGINRLLLSGSKFKGAEGRLPQQLLMLGLTVFALLMVVITLPIEPETRGQVLSLAGVMFTAVVALSSATFVTNAMAGLMLRNIKCIRPGDFVRVKEEFGRITERGLFHVEMETEDGYLTTLPNLFLITNPVSVVRGTSVVISASVSLGYDEPHDRIEELLKEAATKTGLTKAFVHVQALGDYSIEYKVVGLSEDVKSLLSSRSSLRKQMLDSLHAAGVEIMSPAFMSQRQVPSGQAIRPNRVMRSPAVNDQREEPESILFAKADRAQRVEDLKDELALAHEELDELKELNTEELDERCLALKCEALQSKAAGLQEQVDKETLALNEGESFMKDAEDTNSNDPPA